LLHIARGLGTLKRATQMDMAVVSNAMQAVTDDEVVRPDKSALLGPVRTIGLEYPHIRCRSIDLRPTVSWNGPGADKVAVGLAEELAGESGDQVVALRDGDRYIQDFTQVRIDGDDGKTSTLRDRGVYLITGGLGGIGLTLAGHLAESVQAKLILVGHSAFPRKAEWGDWLDTHNEGDRISRKIRSILAMEEKGAEVLVANADVTDFQRMMLVVLTAQKRFGAINGVIHCAGAPDGALIPRRTQALTDAVLTPKITGTRVLDRVVENIDLDFFLLCSSLSSVSGAAGQVAYCTANAFLDAFATTGNKKNGCAVVAVNWDAWQEVGMAADSAQRLSTTASGPEYGSSTPVNHPLLTVRADDAPERKRYISRLDIGTHWVLDEHRLADDLAVLPGTACLELAAAAFRDFYGAGTVEIRDVYFLRPMVVKDGDAADVYTTLKAKDGGFDFTIESRDASGGWVAQAKGWIGGVTHPEPRQRDIKALENQCTNTPAVEISALQAAIEERYGPRWHNLQWVKEGDGLGLAHLKLQTAYRSELTDYLIHPGLLDIATSFLSMMDPALEGLPFSYKRLVINGPLAGDLYSHVTLTASKTGGPCFDITIMDEHGVELVEIESYRLRPIGDGALKDTPVEHTGASPMKGQKKGAPLNGGTGVNLENGILPSEGIEVFNRILAHALNTGASQVLVSTTGDAFLTGQENPSQKNVSRSGTAPLTVTAQEVEPVLTSIWQEFLGIEEMTNLDNFFELGGDSLAGIQIATEIEERLGVSISAAALLEMPTILELTEHIRDLLGEEISQPPSKTAKSAVHERDNSPEMSMAKTGRVASPLVRIA
ncbi:MAG: KR domain-containing protein, partial [Desulfobacterales bacterium]|nr:KR domain-containing protein [Desulfobacterales bacterium]